MDPFSFLTISTFFNQVTQYFNRKSQERLVSGQPQHHWAAQTGEGERNRAFQASGQDQSLY